MLNLNLISKEDKNMFRFTAYQRAVLYLGGVTGIAVIVFIILLIPSFLFLNAQRKEILRELAAEEEALRMFRIEKIEQRVAVLNEKIARIRAQNTLKRRASEFIADIAPRGEGMRIEEINLDFAAAHIEITGVAPTRSALLTLKQSLEKSGFVGEIAIPLIDLVKLTNAAFTLTGILK